MKVLVTGATGFLGSHAAAALVAAGHEVRVLARRPERVPAALAPLGAPPVEVVQGDVTDRDAVARAVDGCQGVLHAANVYSLDPRRADEMHRTNAGSTELVIERARAAGCDPIVHVSSSTVLYPSKGTIPRDPPLGTGRTPYIGSKLAAERIARDAQERGLPVVTTYPGAIYGPSDPAAGEMVHTMRQVLGNRAPLRLPRRAGLSIVDVGWVARAHAALFSPGQGPRRVNMGGHYIAWHELYALLRELTGRRLPQLLPTPAALALASGRLFDLVQRVVPARLPFAYESTWVLFSAAPTDDSLAIELAGAPPPLRDTLAAAIGWMVRAGHLPARLAGRVEERGEITAVAQGGEQGPASPR